MSKSLKKKTNVFFHIPLEMKARWNGSGLCAAFGTIQYWWGFRQSLYEATGQDAHITIRTGLLRSMKRW